MAGVALTQIRKTVRAVLKHTEGALLVILTFMLVADVLLGILARYVQFDVVFAAELGKYTFIWLCAIGISVAAKDNQHVRLTLIVSSIPLSRRLTWVLSQALFLTFTLFLFYQGFMLTLMHWEMNKSAMGFQFPMYIFTAALPIGLGLTSLRLIDNIVNSMRRSTDRPKPWDTQSDGLGGITDEN